MSPLQVYMTRRKLIAYQAQPSLFAPEMLAACVSKSLVSSLDWSDTLLSTGDNPKENCCLAKVVRILCVVSVESLPHVEEFSCTSGLSWPHKSGQVSLLLSP